MKKTPQNPELQVDWEVAEVVGRREKREVVVASLVAAVVMVMVGVCLQHDVRFYIASSGIPLLSPRSHILTVFLIPFHRPISLPFVSFVLQKMLLILLEGDDEQGKEKLTGLLLVASSVWNALPFLLSCPTHISRLRWYFFFSDSLTQNSMFFMNTVITPIIDLLIIISYLFVYFLY